MLTFSKNRIAHLLILLVIGFTQQHLTLEMSSERRLHLSTGAVRLLRLLVRPPFPHSWNPRSALVSRLSSVARCPSTVAVAGI
jgi:hypothetical protein